MHEMNSPVFLHFNETDKDFALLVPADKFVTHSISKSKGVKLYAQPIIHVFLFIASITTVVAGSTVY